MKRLLGRRSDDKVMGRVAGGRAEQLSAAVHLWTLTRNRLITAPYVKVSDRLARPSRLMVSIGQQHPLYILSRIYPIRW